MKTAEIDSYLSSFCSKQVVPPESVLHVGYFSCGECEELLLVHFHRPSPVQRRAGSYWFLRRTGSAMETKLRRRDCRRCSFSGLRRKAWKLGISSSAEQNKTIRSAPEHLLCSRALVHIPADRCRTTRSVTVRGRDVIFVPCLAFADLNLNQHRPVSVDVRKKLLMSRDLIFFLLQMTVCLTRFSPFTTFNDSLFIVLYRLLNECKKSNSP